MGAMAAIEHHIESAQTELLVPRPWGFWATTGLSACIGAAYLVFCVIVSAGYIFASKAKNPELDIMELGHSLESSGTFFAITVIGSSLPTTGLVLLFAKIRKNITIRDYLYLHIPSRRQLLKWSLVVLLYMGTMEIIGFVLTFTGRPIIPEFMKPAVGSDLTKSFTFSDIQQMSRHFRVLEAPFCPQNGPFKKIVEF